MVASPNPSTTTTAAAAAAAAAKPFGIGTMTDQASNNNDNNNDNMILTGESSTQVIDSQHGDYIYKVKMDNYGRRMATCSADRCVRMWDLQDTGEWNLVGQWQAHRGAVTDLAFSHPEFGRLLATCGSDHDAIVWEEKTPGVGVAAAPMTTTTTTHSNPPATAGNNNNSSNPLSTRWIQRASLTDARRSATCLEFAPRHWGLKLAVGSADGCTRIYEAPDIMNLAQWPLHATLQSQSNDVVNSLSWCTGRFEPLTLVVGGTHLMVYRYVESARAWQSILQLPTQQGLNVLDVSWAPNVGRRSHYIAATLDDGQLRVYELLRELNNNNDNKEGAPSQKLALKSEQTLPTESAWSCQWNVTGTVLASSGDGGVVQLWKKMDATDAEFVCVSQVQGDPSGAADATMMDA